MLNWLKTYWPIVVLGLMMLAVVDATLSSLLTCHPIGGLPSSRADPKQAKEYCTALGGPILTSLIWIARITHKYEGLVTAAFTVVLAVFTARLWFSTEKLWHSTNAAVGLAREEFNATHRPKIIVHLAELKRFPDTNQPKESQLDNLGVILYCFNKGRGAAKNVEVRGEIQIGRNIPDAKTKRKMVEPAIESVESGIKIWTVCNSGRPIQELRAFNTEAKAWFVGVIVYFDQNDRRRETGFAFVFDTQSESWISAKSPAHEYAY